MAKETRTKALLLLLIMPVACLAGCGARTQIKVDCRMLHLDEPLGTQTTLVLLPVRYAEEAPSEFADLAGELLAQALSEAGCNVLGPDHVSSVLEGAQCTSSSLLASNEDILILGRITGGDLAFLGTLTRCVYGHLNPSEISFSFLVLDLASGLEAAHIEASAESRKGLSYSRLSKPAVWPDTLLEQLIAEASEVMVRSLKDKKSRTIAKTRRAKE